MEDRLELKYPLIVEGKYDKAKVSMVVKSTVIALNGFSIFSDTEKRRLLKKLASEKGIILLTDSDRAGNFIRSKLKGILSGNIYNVYAPSVLGKERRKNKPSADGLLGVEGIDAAVLKELLKPFEGSGNMRGAGIDKSRFYSDGFSGGNDSSQRRKTLAKLLALPETLTANALLDAINLLVTYEEYITAVERIKNGQ